MPPPPPFRSLLDFKLKWNGAWVVGRYKKIKGGVLEVRAAAAAASSTLHLEVLWGGTGCGGSAARDIGNAWPN